MALDLDSTAALILAAGVGSRLRPLTTAIPKPLLTVNNRAMLDIALAEVPLPEDQIAVNGHYKADQVREHLQNRMTHFSYEPELLGSAGAIGNLLSWIGNRDLLVRNADVWIDGDPSALWEGWDRRELRMLVSKCPGPADFGSYRNVGLSLLPNRYLKQLGATRSSLLSSIWAPAYSTGHLNLVELKGQAIDCGTPGGFLRANLRANGGNSVMSPHAAVHGTLEECVVLAGGYVDRGEKLIHTIRGASGISITVSGYETSARPADGDQGVFQVE